MPGSPSPPFDPDPTDLRAGQSLGRYQLVRRIAQGGMGTIWAARSQGAHGFERLVALKTIVQHSAQDPSFRSMFLDEARIASRVVHPNVVQVLDLGDDQGVLFQVLEWVDGDSLRTLVRLVSASGERIPPSIAIRVVMDASMGLHAAHEVRDDGGALLEVIHRDVSPHNILLSDSGAVKVSDFGIAKARDRMSGDTSEGRIKGKFRYMAPEQAMSHPMDRRADIWALGAILYELLTGHTPYEAPTDLGLLSEILMGPPTLLFEEPLDPAVVAVVRRALSRHPGARYATAAELARELHTAASRADLLAGPDALAELCRRVLGPRADERRAAIRSQAELPAPEASQAMSLSVTIAEPAPVEPVAAVEPSVTGTALDSTVDARPAVSQPARSRPTAWLAGGFLAVAALASGVWWWGVRATADSSVAVAPPASTTATAASVPMAIAIAPQRSIAAAEAESVTAAPAPPSASGARATTPPPSGTPHAGPPRPSSSRPAFERIDDGF